MADFEIKIDKGIPFYEDTRMDQTTLFLAVIDR